MSGVSYVVEVWVDTDARGWVSSSSLKVVEDGLVSADYMCMLTLKRLGEVVRGVDWFNMLCLKKLVDSVRGLERYGKDILRHYADVGLGLDVAKRGVVRPVWDYPFVHEYLFKQVRWVKPIVESVVGFDWYSKNVLRYYVDVGLSVDRSVKVPVKVLLDISHVFELFEIVGWVICVVRDYLVGEHVPVKDVASHKADVGVSVDVLGKGVGKVCVDAGLWADYVLKLGVKVLADAGVISDYVARLPAKALLDIGVGLDRYGKRILKAYLDWCVCGDWIIVPGMVTVFLWDLFICEPTPLRDICKVGFDSVVSSDWKAYDLIACLVEAVRGVDGAYRYIPVWLRDYLAADHDIGFGRAWVIVDKAKFEELVVKVGFTLMGREVWRRVYHKIWFDLVEVADQNVKIAVAQALIDAFKSLYEKLKG